MAAPSSRAWSSRAPKRPSPCPSLSSANRRRSRGRGDADGDPVVLLAVKGQHTDHALSQLSVAPPSVPVVCMQNGVENERRVLRHFPATYGVCVMCPATQLRPGVVQVHSLPGLRAARPGVLPLGHRRARAGDRRRHRDHDVPVGGPPGHHALEVPQAPHEPRQCGRGAVRSRRVASARWPAKRSGRARKCSPRRGSTWRAPRRTASAAPTHLQIVAHFLGRVAGGVQLAEPRPRGGLHRGRVLERGDRAARRGCTGWPPRSTRCWSALPCAPPPRGPPRARGASRS